MISLKPNSEGFYLFKDIPLLTQAISNSKITLEWLSLKSWILEAEKLCNFELKPWFQRNYVWTLTQKSRYIEYILRGGRASKDIYI